ncbi:S9 family peptidase [Aliikangiella marina]|uniref:S9 family peptidase n=1 Tax=Aliikangiella marina TaxID=1712262 RepID=A0A545TA07_9GAMM|nr:S9 family peptidase [Aliikangiella marina]TQV74049.1 S9 family peptidase [Aliikangiella marina]
MIRLFACLVIITITFTIPVSAKKLTIERLFASPSLSGPSVRGLKISPDGTRVTFLKGKESDHERLDLWEYHIASGETRLLFDSDDLHSGNEALSDEEKARRERMRLSGSGIVSYQWSKDGTALLFPLAGDVYYYKVGDKKARKVVSTPEFETDVKFSPKANYISYIREQNLYVLDLQSGKETAITQDGGGPIKYGMAEFVAQEEMKRMTGYWWSGDESKIAFTKVDESPVEEVTRSEIYADDIKMIKQRYPFAGKNNVVIELAVIELDSNKVTWVDLGKNNDIYLPRVKWTNDSNQLSFQWQSRDQKTLRLNIFDTKTKKQKRLIEETSNTWINLHDDLYFLTNDNFIWTSERDNFKHIYLFDKTGKQLKQLTRGDWVVDKVENIDQKRGLVYFTGRKDTPLERHLYSVSINTGDIKKITSRSGFHTITFAGDSQTYINNFSSINTPPQVSLHKSTGERLAWLSENKVDDNHPLADYKNDLITPEFGTFTTDDNTKLYYRLYKPSNFDDSKKYPVFIYLYGGPIAQTVTNRWGNLYLTYMAQQGYVVFTVDNRGSNYRGKAFEDPLYRAMGKIEVKDQVAGVKFLRTFPWVDKEKIGVHGHSYGGYMTLMAMFQAPEYFKAGVSGAPVTDWALYDTHYTERYMGTPQEDPQAYEESSVFPYATNLVGPLLIYHGMADDNVLFKNSTKLYKVLQDNNIQFMTMDYPGKKHSIRGKKTRMHRATMIRNFFDLHFGIKR